MSMARTLLLLLSFLAATSFAYAQTGEIQGKVTDADTGEGIPFANVSLSVNGTLVGAQTDFEGFYTIKPLPPGQYEVKISYVGYQEQVIQDVLGEADKITFLDVKLQEQTEMLDIVKVVAYRVPLLKADETATGATVTKEQIQSLPTRDVQSIAGNTAGVYQEDEGSSVNVKGSRDEATDYYIDGIKVRGSSNLPASAIEQMTIVTGGVPARYGDATGGIINITTRGPSSKFAGGVEVITSKFLDPYGYYLANFNLSGPLFSVKKDGNKRPIMGFFIAAEYLHEDDDDPSATGIWTTKEDVLADIKANPLRRSATATGFDKAVDFVTLDDLEKRDTKQNIEKDQVSLAGKIDIQPSNNITVTLGGNFNYNRGGLLDRTLVTRRFVRRNELFNIEHTPEYNRDVYRGYVRFTQRFANRQDEDVEEGEERKSSLLQNAYYNVQFDYTRSTFNAQDPLFEDRLFEYGHVGQFAVDRTPVYSQATIGNLQGWEFQGFQENNVTYSSEGVTNLERAAHNDQYFALAGEDRELYYSSLNQIRANNGFINGDAAPSLEGSYSLWHTPGTPYGTFRNFTGDQYRLSFNGSFDLKRPGSAERNKHAIGFGFEYEQRIDRDYFVWNAPAIWDIMFNRVAQPDRGIVRDLANPILVIDGNEYSLGEYENLQNSGSDIVFSSNDTIKYNYVRVGEQSNFDKNFRERFGYDNLGFVDVFNHKPEEFSLDMLSPDELFNGGGGSSIFLGVSGYDYSGNRLSSKPSFNDFWTAKDENGNFTRLQDAFRPIYTAGYIQDKFAFRDLIFNIGVRVDRFDANQKVPKDQFVPLYGTFKAGEVSSIGGESITHPSTVGDDYVVYVDDVVNPSRITGYRDQDQWYSPTGLATSDPRTLFGETGTIAPYLSNPLSDNPAADIRLENYNPDDAFEDYKPQVTVMPRVAFSFEISEAAIFFAHYDVLSQRPQSRIVMTPYDYFFFASNTLFTTLNNANLRPERTIDYQIGFKQKISTSSALSVSGFYRELKDMVQIVNITSAYPSTYTTFGNLDFGTVKGLEVSYDLRRTGNVRLTANYTLQFADGTGSGDASQANLADFGQPNLRSIYPLSYDARHMFNINFDYRYGEGKNYDGPKLFGKDILANAGINFIFRGRSGTPYTKQAEPTPEAQYGIPTRPVIDGTINGSRLPWNMRIDTRIEKDFKLDFSKKEGKSSKYLTAYLLIQNLLDTDNIANIYEFTGSPDDDGYIPSAIGQQSVAAQTDQQAFVDQYAIKVADPNNYSIPRRIRLGLSFGF